MIETQQAPKHILIDGKVATHIQASHTPPSPGIHYLIQQRLPFFCFFFQPKPFGRDSALKLLPIIDPQIPLYFPLLLLQRNRQPKW